MRPYAALVLGLALTGCLSVSEEPLGSETLPGDYHRLAVCVEEHFSRIGYEMRVVENHHDHTTKVSAGITNLGYAHLWDTTFRAIGPNQTRIEVRAMTTITGPETWPREILGPARNCARTIASR